MLSWVDAAIGAVILAALIVGAFKGFVRMAVGIVATVGGFILAATYYQRGADLLSGLISRPVAARFASFLIILFLTVLAGMLLVAILSKLIRGPLKFLDRLGGLLFGVAQGVLVCGALVFALTVFPVDRTALQNSRYAPVCSGMTKAMISLIPLDLRDQFKKAYQEIVSKGGKFHG